MFYGNNQDNEKGQGLELPEKLMARRKLLKLIKEKKTIPYYI